MIDGNTPIHTTLSAEHWRLLLQGADQMPHGIIRPVIDEVRRQIVEAHPSAFEVPQASMAPPPRVNGLDASAGE